MPEPKPVYKVNPDIEEACNEAARLLHYVLGEIKQLTPKLPTITITIDYNKWEKMNDVLSAIREMLVDWNDQDSFYLQEISDLLKKAGY